LCAEIGDKINALLTFPGSPAPGLRPEQASLRGSTPLCEAAREGRIVSVAVIVTVAVNGNGRREVLGLAIGPSEN
jgi:hypothetical protein